MAGNLRLATEEAWYALIRVRVDDTPGHEWPGHMRRGLKAIARSRAIIETGIMWLRANRLPHAV
jgi:hypothetical protein